jgi:hypothetical protein
MAVRKPRKPKKGKSFLVVWSIIVTAKDRIEAARRTVDLLTQTTDPLKLTGKG